MRIAPGALLCAVIALAAPVRAQTVSDDVRIRMTGRLQAQFSSTSVEPLDIDADGSTAVPSTMFETRRIRIAAEITIRDWIVGFLEPDFAAGTVQLRLAFMNLAITDAVQLRAGQFKKPFSRIQLESSLTIPTIERGVRLRGLSEALTAADEATGTPVLTSFGGRPLLGEEQSLLDALAYDAYDIGAQMHGVVGRFTWAAGVFNGAGPNRADENDRKSVAARATYNLASAPLAVGMGVGYQERLHPDTRDGTAIEVDAEWGGFRRQGVRMLAELAAGGTIAADDRFLAAQVMLSYFQRLPGERMEGIEPVARVSFGDPRKDVEGDAGVLLTPGFNVYFFGRNRLSLNWDVYVPEGDRFETTHGLRAQAQLHF